MAEDSDLERTEPASDRRLEEARNKGKIARSQELVTFSLLMTGLVGVIVLAPGIGMALKQMMTASLTFDQRTVSDPLQLSLRLLQSAQDTLLALLPLFGLSTLAALGAPLIMGGWLFTLEPLEPDFNKINPATGIARIFSTRTLAEMVKAILKSLLIGGVAAMVIWNERNEVLQLIALPPVSGILHVWELVKFTLLLVIGSLSLLVAIDVPYQLWEYHKGLRMTKEEVRQEAKEAEGDPQLKGRIRQLQREAARRRMMTEIPKADVVVTNPTHYAVALKYEASMQAPKVVAKGSYLLAERIIALAREHRVTVLRTPPLARALYHHTELGDEIPAQLYTATAEVLAYLYQLRHFEQHGGAKPTLNDKLPVPAELDPEADGGAQ